MCDTSSVKVFHGLVFAGTKRRDSIAQLDSCICKNLVADLYVSHDFQPALNVKH